MCDMVNAIISLNKAVELYEADKKGKNKIEFETAKHKFKECIRKSILHGNDVDQVLFSMFTAVIDILRNGTRIHPNTIRIAEEIFKEIARNYVEYGYSAIFKILMKEVKLRY